MMRLRFMFWLDLDKKDEYLLAEQIENLKEKRSFARTIRDGIRLMCDLQAGKLDVLQQLFPWIWEQIALQIEANPSQKQTDEAAASSLQAQLDRMERILLNQGALPIENGKPSQAPVPPKPDFHTDIELNIKTVTTKDENNNSSWNFMIASSLQVYGTCEGLPTNIIEYGLRTGRISPEKAGKALPKKPTTAKKSEAGNAKAMHVPQFDAPVFDDDSFVDDFPISFNSG